MGFGKMIIGYFFVLFDVNLGKIGIFPDVIGYILIYYGVKEVLGKLKSDYFSNLKKVCRLLIVLSALDLIIKYTSTLNNVINNPAVLEGKIFTILFMITMVTLSIYAFINLSMGIEAEAGMIKANELAEKARAVKKLFTIYQTISGIFFIITTLAIRKLNFNISVNGGFLLLIFLIVFIVYVYLFIQVRSLLKQADLKFGGEMR